MPLIFFLYLLQADNVKNNLKKRRALIYRSRFILKKYHKSHFVEKSPMMICSFFRTTQS